MRANFWTRKWGLWSMMILTAATAACTSSTRVLLTDKLPTRPTKIQEMMVYLGAPPIKARPLAMISVIRRGENSVWAVEALKSEAAEMGADAISNLDISYSPGFFPELRVAGVAVKYGAQE